LLIIGLIDLFYPNSVPFFAKDGAPLLLQTLALKPLYYIFTHQFGSFIQQSVSLEKKGYALIAFSFRRRQDEA
jgi:hypothetical protein